MAFTYVTITHVFETAADVAAGGEVEFTPVAAMHNGLTVVAKPVVAQLTANGDLSQKLAANTDPGTTPSGSTYRVVERITGQRVAVYYVQVPHDQGSTLDLRELAGWTGATGGSGGGGGVQTINGEAPNGAGNVVVSASDVGAQPADLDLTGLAGLTDGYPVRAGGAWLARSAAQLATDIGAGTAVVNPVVADHPGVRLVIDPAAGYIPQADEVVLRSIADGLPPGTATDNVGMVPVYVGPGSYDYQLLTPPGAGSGGDALVLPSRTSPVPAGTVAGFVLRPGV